MAGAVVGPLKRLIAMIIDHDDRWPLIGSFGWIVGSVVGLVGSSALVGMISLAIGFPQLQVIFVLPASALTFLAVVVASALFYERIWMFVGVYRFHEFEDHCIRKRLRLWLAA